MITTVDAMKMLFNCLKPSSIMRLSRFQRDAFRTLITSNIEEFSLNKASINSDIYIILNIIKSDPDYFLMDDLSSVSAMKRYDAIKTILNNIYDFHKKYLLPQDDTFCKFCLNYQEFMSHKQTPPCLYSMPKKVQLHPEIIEPTQCKVFGTLTAEDCVIKLGLSSPKWVIRNGAWTSNVEDLIAINTKYRRSLLNLYSENCFFWGKPNKKTPQMSLETGGFIRNIDIASCPWSGFSGVATYEVTTEGVPLYYLRIYSVGLKLARTIVLDSIFKVLNTSRHPVEVFSLEFLRIKPADGSNKFTLACIARNVHLLIVDVASGRRVSRYQPDSERLEKISLAKPLKENFFLVGYEDFVLHHLYFSGAYHPELFMKIWLPDVAIACCNLSPDTYGLLHRHLERMTVVRVSDKSIHLFECHYSGNVSSSAGDTIVLVNKEEVANSIKILNQMERYQNWKGSLNCTIVKFPKLREDVIYEIN